MIEKEGGEKEKIVGDKEKKTERREETGGGARESQTVLMMMNLLVCLLGLTEDGLIFFSNDRIPNLSLVMP